MLTCCGIAKNVRVADSCHEQVQLHREAAEGLHCKSRTASHSCKLSMVGTGRKRSIAFFIALGAGLISVVILLYVGWVLLNWRTGILLFLGVLLLLAIIAGVVLNTLFLVREIRRNEQHDAFINAVTHELKTPVASIRLYLETLQTRASMRTSARSSTASCWTTATGCCRPSSRSCAPAGSVRRGAS